MENNNLTLLADILIEKQGNAVVMARCVFCLRAAVHNGSSGRIALAWSAPGS
jgi:hypothetical protein